MARKLVVALFIALVVVALWFALRSEPPVAPTPTPSASTIEAPPVDAAKITEESALDSLRSVAINTPTSVAPATPTASDGRTLLVVHVLEQETELPRANVEVTVRDPSLALPAWKHVDRIRGTIDEALKTAAEGFVEFAVEPGHALSIRAVTPDRSTSAASLDVAALSAGEHRDVTVHVLTLQDQEFHGRVVARETKQPLMGARITERDKERARSDADGRFTFAWADWNSSKLDVSADGYASAHFLAAEAADSIANERTFELDRAATLIVKLASLPADGAASYVLQAETKSYALIEDAKDGMRGYSGAEPRRTASFDARGRATLENMPPNVEITARATLNHRDVHVERDAIVLQPGERRELTWKLGAGCRVTVTVSEGTTPLPDVALSLLKGDGRTSYVRSFEMDKTVQRVKTGADGRAVFDDLGAGAWMIVPSETKGRSSGVVDPSAIAPAPLSFTIAVDEHELALDYHAQRGLYIEGRVLDPDGKPCPSGLVFGVGDQGDEPTSGVGKGGRFALGPLRAGHYLVHAREPMRYLPSQPVDALSGAKDVELRLITGAKLTGKVVDAVTGGGGAATVSMSRPQSPDSPSYMEISTNPDGTFRIDAIEPGTYCMCATTKDGRIGIATGVSVDLAHESEDVVLRVAPGGRLSVRYDGREGVGTVRVFAGPDMINCDGLNSGTPATFVAPAGSVRVEFTVHGTKETKRENVTVIAGEERDVVFRD